MEDIIFTNSTGGMRNDDVITHSRTETGFEIRQNILDDVTLGYLRSTAYLSDATGCVDVGRRRSVICGHLEGVVGDLFGHIEVGALQREVAAHTRCRGEHVKDMILIIAC